MTTKTKTTKTAAPKGAAKVATPKVATKPTKTPPPSVTLTGTRRFAVAASYTGDCCATPHVWVLLVRATDAVTAEQMLRKRVVAKSFTCHDVIALPFSPKTKTPPSTPSGHRPVLANPVTGLKHRVTGTGVETAQDVKARQS